MVIINDTDKDCDNDSRSISLIRIVIIADRRKNGRPQAARYARTILLQKKRKRKKNGPRPRFEHVVCFSMICCSNR